MIINDLFTKTKAGALLTALLIVWLSTSAAAKPHPHPREVRPLDLSPVLVQAFPVASVTDPKQKAYLQHFHLEDGVQVKATRYLTPQEVTTRDLFILQITQSLEGGFDSVNVYDRGVLSWGIMQWTAHEGSLYRALVFVKRRLWQTHQHALWDKLFVANGLDADGKTLRVYGKPITDALAARLLFRGSAKVGNFDPKLVTHWATVLARAGRQPEVAALQIEYAQKIVDGVLQNRLVGLPYHAPGRQGLTVADLAGSDPYTEALVFALWTNNPRHAWEYVAESAEAARSVSSSSSNDPGLWQPGAFSAALLRRCGSSRFGNWSARAALIEARAVAVRSAAPSTLTPFEREYQLVLSVRKARRQVELASRHLQRMRAAPERKKDANQNRAADLPRRGKNGQESRRIKLPESTPAG